MSLKLRLTIEAEIEVEKFGDIPDVEADVESALEYIRGQGTVKEAKLLLDLDSIKTRDRETVIMEWDY